MPNTRINNVFKQHDRYYVLNDAQGITTETFDHRSGASGISPTASGQLRINVVPVLDGDIINTLGVYCTSVGSGVTLFKLGVWDASGKLLGVTSNLSLNAQAWVTGDLTTPVTINYSGVAYFGILAVYTTTAPTFEGAANPGNNWMTFPNGFKFGWTWGSQTDIAGNFNFGAAGAGTQTYYIVGY